MKYLINAEARGQGSANSIKRAKYLVRLWTHVRSPRYYDDGCGTIWVFRNKARMDLAETGAAVCLATIRSRKERKR